MATYYVDYTLGDDSRTAGQAESPLTPWKTLAKIAAASHTYRLKRGEDFGDARIRNNNNDWTVEAYYNDDGTDDTTKPKPVVGGPTNSGIYLDAAKTGITIKNLYVRGDKANQYAVYVDGAEADLYGLDVVPGISGGIYFRAYASNLTGSAKFCTVTGGGYGAGIINYSAGAGKYTLTVEDTVISGHTTGSGFGTTNGVSHLLRVTSHDNYFDGFTIVDTASGSTINATACVAYNNGTVGVAGTGDGFTAHSGNVLNCYYCLSYNNKKSGFLAIETTSGNLWNCIAANNIGSAEGSYGIGCGSGTWEIKNCIEYGHTTQLYIPTVGTVDSDNNIFYNSLGGATPFRWGGANLNWADYKTASSQDGHSISANPILANFVPLAVISPCIDAGVDVGLLTDIEGTAVVAPPNIGAYERSVSVGGLYCEIEIDL